MGVTEGREKMARKAGSMKQAYDAAKGRMVSEWQAGLQRAGTPPGPISTSNYQAGVAAANFRAPDPAKWEEGFRRGISK